VQQFKGQYSTTETEISVYDLHVVSSECSNSIWKAFLSWSFLQFSHYIGYDDTVNEEVCDLRLGLLDPG
jgi:hypothetical protein